MKTWIDASGTRIMRYEPSDLSSMEPCCLSSRYQVCGPGRYSYYVGNGMPTLVQSSDLPVSYGYLVPITNLV